jgi:uncharacterized RDD family membrane protein YckC
VPYGAAAVPNYAGFWQRFAGWLLDQFLYGLLFALFAVPAIILGFQAFDGCRTIRVGDEVEDIVCPPGKPEGGLLGLSILLGVVGVLLVTFIYLRALGRTGQTWGRQIVGVRVVRKQGDEPLGFGLAFLRQFIQGLISGSLCGLGFLWMLWDKDKQTWHDKITGTIVVRT